MVGANADEVGAYLDRLGVAAEPPSAEALGRLQRAHVEHVPWETLWIHEGRRWSSDVADSMTRIATTTRGGYCFHLNGAFGELLSSLGYSITRHVGGVHGPDGPAPTDMTNHLALMVHDLPTDANPEGVWYVDVGLGDALYEPVPLVAGRYRHEPFELALDPVEVGLGDWHLTHGEGGSFAGMSWSATPTEMDVFAHRHEWLSTNPASGFMQTLVVQRRQADSVVVLRGLLLRRIGAGASETEIASRDEFVDVLRSAFDIELELDGHRLDELWDRVSTDHATWRASQGAASG